MKDSLFHEAASFVSNLRVVTKDSVNMLVWFMTNWLMVADICDAP
jgi:hypothetical protein